MKAFFCLSDCPYYNKNGKLHEATHEEYKTQYHIVWIVSYRKKILATEVKSYLKIKFQEIRKYYPEWEYIDIEIKNGYFHVLMGIIVY